MTPHDSRVCGCNATGPAAREREFSFRGITGFCSRRSDIALAFIDANVLLGVDCSFRRVILTDGTPFLPVVLPCFPSGPFQPGSVSIYSGVPGVRAVQLVCMWCVLCGVLAGTPHSLLGVSVSIPCRGS